MNSRLAAAVGIVALALAAPGAAEAAGPVSSHAMVHTCCMSAAQKERLFAESKALGATFIRVDFELSAIFGAPGAPPDWSRVDRVLELSRRYDLPVLGIVLGTPAWNSTCPHGPDASRCGASDPGEYGRLAGELAAHAGDAVDHWEILNEPDGEWAFLGSPEEYARMLSASHDAIRARAPGDVVLLGGMMRPASPGWMDRVFATPGADAIHKFQIASAHLRGKAADMPRNLARFRALLARHGFTGPTWVTEHGYSADPAYQADPAFVGGEDAQAGYLRSSVLGLAEGGADQVFVTLRDIGDREWAAEGIVDFEETGDFAARRRPAFDTLRRLAADWPQIVEWRRQQRLHEQRASNADALARSAELRLSSLQRSQADARDALVDQARELRRVRAARCGRRNRRCHRRLARRAATGMRRARVLSAELRRLARATRRQKAIIAARRADQAASAFQAIALRDRIEG